MLHRRRIPEVYLWIIAWFALALILLLVFNTLTVPPTISAG